MTLRPDYDTPCWEVVDVKTGRPPQEPYGDGWPHYRTRREAAEAIAEQIAENYDDRQRYALEPVLLLRAAESFGGPCLMLFCDGPNCDPSEACDFNDDGWTHLDPSDPIPFGLDEIDWLEVDGKHYCPECHPPFCDDCDERHAPDECPDAPPRAKAVPHCEGQLTIDDALADDHNRED